MADADEIDPPSTWRWGSEGPLAPGPAILVDIDGVIANGEHRQRFMRTTPKQFDAFFDAAVDDTPIVETAVLLRLLDRRLITVLLTGRPVRIREQTIAWLAANGFTWDLLVMRADGDRQPNTRYKRDVARRLKDDGFHLVLAFDDGPDNAAMFREEGVPCVYVHSGYYG